MKRLLSILTGLAFALSLTAFAQNTPGQSPSQTPSQTPSTQSPSSQSPASQTGAQSQQQVDTQSARAFEGKITKSGDKLVLQEASTHQSYQLDDQDKAKQYEGKNVKVTATMDPNTNTLHVVDIASAER